MRGAAAICLLPLALAPPVGFGVRAMSAAYAQPRATPALHPAALRLPPADAALATRRPAVTASSSAASACAEALAGRSELDTSSRTDLATLAHGLLAPLRPPGPPAARLARRSSLAIRSPPAALALAELRATEYSARRTSHISFAAALRDRTAELALEPTVRFVAETTA